MRIEQLICFNEVKKLHSFSKAADALFLSQSSLSKQIKALEEEIGEPLFLRRRNAAQLTPAGRKIAPYAEEMTAAYEKMLSSVKGSSLSKTQESLKAAAFFNMGACAAGRAVAAFEARRPDFRIDILECSHSQMRSYMKSGGAEIYIGYREFLAPDDGFDEMPLAAEPLALVVGSEHPLAAAGRINLSDAKDERFCFPREDPELFLYYLNNCARNGFAPFLTHSDVRLSTLKNYISAGMRCTIQIKDAAESFFSDPRFKVIEIADVAPLTLSLIFPRGELSPLARQFIRFMREYFVFPG
ncbi:MAG: LysR family transcriptional regulator [Oscillospiraceae bacterium]|nr:LysR family transcriptional regulator [Oscillospiraceae bacterium]